MDMRSILPKGIRLYTVGAEHWEDEIAYELFTNVINENVFWFDTKL